MEFNAEQFKDSSAVYGTHIQMPKSDTCDTTFTEEKNIYIVLVLLPAYIKRLSVSRIRDFLLMLLINTHEIKLFSLCAFFIKW